MLKAIWAFIRKNPSTVALAIATLLAGANLALLARAYRSTRAAGELAVQTAPLKAALAELQRAKEEGFASLRTDIASAEARVASLRRAFPKTGAPFDLYRRSFALADLSNVKIVSVEVVGITTEDTAMGRLTTTRYSLQAEGSLQRCLTLISRLEDEGLKTLAADNILIDASDQSCNFDVDIADLTPQAANQGP